MAGCLTLSAKFDKIKVMGATRCGNAKGQALTKKSLIRGYFLLKMSPSFHWGAGVLSDSIIL